MTNKELKAFRDSISDYLEENKQEMFKTLARLVEVEASSAKRICKAISLSAKDLQRF